MFRDDNGEGQMRLRRVLHAYSRLDTDVGYCQGMGFITAMLLTYFPEEEAFYFLRAIMTAAPGPIRGLYLPGMPLAQEMMFVGDGLLRRFLPSLWRHFERQGVHYSMYSTQWFVTIYTNCFPFEVVTRIWDAFLLEGLKVVYRVQLALLKTYEKVSCCCCCLRTHLTCPIIQGLYSLCHEARGCALHPSHPAFTIRAHVLMTIPDEYAFLPIVLWFFNDHRSF
jgi:hypothetical protein